jgi:hypothetical protein
MKTRSSLEICLPLVIGVALCLASLPTLVLTLIWLTIGVCSLGHLTLEQMPANGIPWQWFRGPRSVVLWIFHLAWWPWYMRFELKKIAARAREVIKSRCGGLSGTRRIHRAKRKSNGDDRS